jgi:IS6 family transposase
LLRIEQDHQRIKRLVRPELGFKSFVTAPRTLAGDLAMAMIRKCHAASVPTNDMQAQREFTAALFRATA